MDYCWLSNPDLYAASIERLKTNGPESTHWGWNTWGLDPDGTA